MHSKAIIHRKKKPQNILFDHNNEPILTDFGLANAANLDYSLSVTGQFVGTVAYAAPEQIQNAKGIDGQADFWALGVTLFEMLTGQRPFTGESQMVLAKAIVSGKPKDIKDLRPDLSEDLVQEVAKCLRIELAAKERNDTHRGNSHLYYVLTTLMIAGVLLCLALIVMDQDTKNNEAPVSNGPAKITLRISQHKEWKVEQLDIDHIQFRTSAIDTISQKVTATQIHWIHEGKGKFVISSGSISSSELSFKSGAIIDIQKVQFTDCKLITTGQGTSMNFRECKFTRCALSLERSTLLEIDKCIGEPSITRKP